jgi:acyl dehydratase
MATRELDRPPGMLGLYAKAAMPAVPLLGGARKGGDVPDLELVVRDQAVDLDHLARYARVCGFGLRDELPPTYPHVLAFPLHMALMTDDSFPFPVMGVVHLTNAITQHRPVRSTERLDLRVRATEGEPHPKGRMVELITEARVGDELVWEEATGVLRRGGGTGGTQRRDEPADPPAEAVWRVPAGIGRRYAEVSGDRNPIHMSDLAAKLFGFKRAIAHGMWTKARALAQLGARVPDAFTVDVRFEKPLFIPAKVVFAAEDGRFAVRDEKTGTRHLTGELS